MERIEYEVELERVDGPADHTRMTLPPALTKGQRLNVPVEGGYVHAEVIEVTKLTTGEPTSGNCSRGNWGSRSRNAQFRSISSMHRMMIEVQMSGRLSRNAVSGRLRRMSNSTGSTRRQVPTQRHISN
jgi:hypothetical protein